MVTALTAGSGNDSVYGRGVTSQFLLKPHGKRAEGTAYRRCDSERRRPSPFCGKSDGGTFVFVSRLVTLTHMIA